MGIDARMLVRNVRSDVVSDEWLKELSWRLCESIGAEHFFISADPTEPRLALDRADADWCADDDASATGAEYYQDGATVYAGPGECLLRVSLWSRYYGKGYERGDILVLSATAEWLEANIPGCEVWYGGDSSGVCLELFDDYARRAFRSHLYSASGRDYYKSFGLGAKDLGHPEPCVLCPGGTYRGIRNGYGPTYAAFSCHGCGRQAETQDSGLTWQERKEQ
jgi:hypothetical protein